VNPDKLRIWVARLGAPLAFFFAAVILVVLVQRALDRQEDTSSSASASNTDTIDTGAATTPGVTDTSGLPRACQKRNYRVRPGDTLEVIAARCQTTVDVLLELNPDIDPLALSPGQKVHLRAPAT
jgi:LysM repeat protein